MRSRLIPPNKPSMTLDAMVSIEVEKASGEKGYPLCQENCFYLKHSQDGYDCNLFDEDLEDSDDGTYVEVWRSETCLYSTKGN